MIRLLTVLLVTSAVGACGASEPASAPASAPTSAAAPAVSPPAAVITEGEPPKVFGPLLVTPGGFDLGAIDPNSAHVVRVTLINRGSEPISIVETESSCKCTVPDLLDGTVIAAGQSVPMSATFSAGAAPGPKGAKILLKFRTPSRPRLQLALIEIAGEVTMKVRAVPPFVDALKGVNAGTVRVESMDGRTFAIVTAGGEPPRYAGGFDPGRDKPRNAYTLRWSVKYPASEDDCGGERLWWVVETDHPDCPILPLRIRHECTGLLMDRMHQQRGWMFHQYMLNVGAVVAGTPVDLDAEVRRLNDQPTSGIYAVESLSPEATVEFLGILEPPGDSTTVRLRFTPRAGTEGMLYAMVNFKSPTGFKEIAFLVRVLPR